MTTLRPRVAASLVGAMIAAHVAIYSVVCAVKYRFYLYRDFDLAIFAQATDQVLRGSMFSSIRGMNWLGDHASLILLALAPVYAVLRHPLTLLVLQSAALALGAWPVFRLARRELAHDGAALAFALVYLLQPALGYVNLYEFHPESLAVPAIAFALDFVRARRLRAAAIAVAIALLCREDVALLVLGIAAYALAIHRRAGVRVAATLGGLAALSLALSFGVLRPLFNNGEAAYAGMYGSWGRSLVEIAVNVARRPHAALAALVATPGDAADSSLKLWYHVLMLSPLAWLPLASPLTLLVALPILLEHFLSWRTPQHEIVYQYATLVSPVLAVAAVVGARNVAAAFATARRGRPAARMAPGAAVLVAAGVAVAAALACTALYGPLVPKSRVAAASRPQPNAPDSLERTLRPYRDRMVARLPREGGVVAGFEFLPHVANRANVHSAHHVLRGEYTFSARPYPTPTGIAALVLDTADPSLIGYVEPKTGRRLRDLVQQNDLRPVDSAGDLTLWERGGRGDPLVSFGRAEVAAPRRIVYDETLAWLGVDGDERRVAAGGVVPLRFYWSRVAPTDRLYMQWLVVADANGRKVFQQLRHLGYAIAPVADWPAVVPVMERYRLLVPQGTPPGRYTLLMRPAWAKGEGGAMSETPDVRVRATDGFVLLGPIEVVAR